jgi:hypothetical protein
MIVTHTASNLPASNEGALRTATFRYILSNVLDVPKGKRVADLGAGPCIFSKIAADSGYRVIAFDGRDDRVPNDLGNVIFLKQDIRNFSSSGFDVVLILGLLYHLTLDDQIKLLAECNQAKAVIVDTQVHIPDLVVSDASASRNSFSDTVVTKGPYSGVLFPEVNNPMASIGNQSSWWHTEDSMIKIFEDTGYKKCNVIGEPYVSKYGARRWYLLT